MFVNGMMMLCSGFVVEVECRGYDVGFVCYYFWIVLWFVVFVYVCDE